MSVKDYDVNIYLTVKMLTVNVLSAKNREEALNKALLVAKDTPFSKFKESEDKFLAIIADESTEIKPLYCILDGSKGNDAVLIDATPNLKYLKKKTIKEVPVDSTLVKLGQNQEHPKTIYVMGPKGWKTVEDTI